MPKTIIKRRTWGCEGCNWNTDNPDFEGVSCPSCREHEIQRETDPDRMGTLTVMGEEDIEDEFVKNKDGKFSRLLHDMPVKTEAQKNAYRAKRKEDIRKAIIEARKVEEK